MSQPVGFVNEQNPIHVCLLHKALYGLKQAPRLWYSTLSSYLLSQGFTQSTADPSLFIYHTSTTHIYLLIYVDDILLTGNSPTSNRTLITTLQSRFSMKDLGTVSTFLGINIQKTPYGYFLNQTSYLHSIIQSANLQHAKPVPTPMPVKPTTLTDQNLPFDQPHHYRHLAGSLQYLTITRPDIAFTVNYLCQHMHTPTQAHFTLLKRVLRYLNGTSTLGLPLRAGPLRLSSYSDSDWAGDPTNRRSTTGYCTFLGSSLISWRAQKQKTVARSSTEAEFCALAANATDLLWIRRLLSEFGASITEPTTIFCDNTSAIALASNPLFHARMKHVEIDFHFLRDHISNKQLAVHHIPTQDQIADVFTKPQPIPRFLWLRDKLTITTTDHELAGGSQPA